MEAKFIDPLAGILVKAGFYGQEKNAERTCLPGSCPMEIMHVQCSCSVVCFPARDKCSTTLSVFALDLLFNDDQDDPI